MNILFIGNSYTYYNDLPKIFEKTAVENGFDVSVFSVTKGNRKLIDNVLCDDDYTKQLENLISAYRFEYAFLQEYSTLPLTNKAEFENGVKKLCDKLKPSVDNIVLYETWSRKEGNKTLTENGWNVKMMTDGLAKSYCEVGKSAGVSVSYAGLSFYEALDADELYDNDGTHPSYSGSCLAALTHYCHVFGTFPEKTEHLNLSEKVIESFKTAIERGAKYCLVL